MQGLKYDVAANEEVHVNGADAVQSGRDILEGQRVRRGHTEGEGEPGDAERGGRRGGGVGARSAGQEVAAWRFKSPRSAVGSFCSRHHERPSADTLGALICAAQADKRKIFKECMESSNLERGDMKGMHFCEKASDLNDKHVKFLHCMMMKQEMMDKDCRITVDRQIISDKIDKKCDEMAESTGAVAEAENEEQKGEEEEGGDKKNKKKGCWWKKLCEPERRENFKKNMTECVDKAVEAYNSAEGTSDQCRNTVFTMKDCMQKKIARKMGRRGKGKKTE